MSNDPNRIRQEIEATRSELSGDVDALAYKMNPRRIAGDGAARARGGFIRAKEKVMGVAHEDGGPGAGQRMAHAAGSVRGEARSMARQSREQAEGNPFAAGMIAFGAGLLVASLIPPSRPEHQLAGQARRAATGHSAGLREQAGRMGHEMRDNLREPARQATEAVRSTAAGGASTLREQGREAAGQVQGQTRQAAGELRRH